MEGMLRWLGYFLIGLGVRLVRMSDRIGRQSLKNRSIIGYRRAPLAEKVHLVVPMNPSDGKWQRSLCRRVTVDTVVPVHIRLSHPAVCGACREKLMMYPHFRHSLRKQKGLL